MGALSAGVLAACIRVCSRESDNWVTFVLSPLQAASIMARRQARQ